MTIKSIETKYNGYNFRSRLEARWAVFFNSLGIEFRYEHEGYKNEKDFYLPDFEIKLSLSPRIYFKYYVEVKGDKDWIKNNYDYLEQLHDFGGILPNFKDCAKNEPFQHSLIILGDVPYLKHGIIYFPIICHNKGISIKWVSFDGQFISKCNFTDEKFIKNIDSYSLSSKEAHDFQIKTLETTYANPDLAKSLEKARSARFEHGEKS